MAWPDNVDRTQLTIEYYRGSGPGGQHRNKRDTACRITHDPTGISASAEDNKSQIQNRNAAFNRLAKKLIPLLQAARKVDLPESNSDERIRSYNEKRNTVTDHRTGTTKPYDKTLDGNLDDFHKEHVINKNEK